MPNEATQVEELSLDDALANPEPGEVKEAPATEAPDTTEATTETKETVETKEAAPPAAKPKEEAWHLTAVMDEREKRQAAQRELEELKKQLEAAKTPKQKTSVLEDEDKFRNEFMEEVRNDLMNERLNMSQAFAEREFGKDVVAEKVKTFKELAANNPELRARFASAPLPFHELVSIVNKHAELKELENVDAYKEKLRAEVRAELLKESEEKQQGEAKKRESITPSLASKRSAGGVKNSDSLIGLDDVFKT
jgi:hypothetical protein